MTAYRRAADQMYQAALKQAYERSDREGKTMVIYRRDCGAEPPVWYVRSLAEGDPKNATAIVEVRPSATRR